MPSLFAVPIAHLSQAVISRLIQRLNCLILLKNSFPANTLAELLRFPVALYPAHA
jgi:hypothetical protein